MPPELSYLVLDAQIRVEFHQTAHDRFTFESVTLSGKYTGLREREHIWIKNRLLVHGSHGDVYLHRCQRLTVGGGETKSEAVKTIAKARMASNKIKHCK
jgi:hypothetical protein